MIANAAATTIWVAEASGVIGRTLCPLLIEDGWSVVGMTRSPDTISPLRDMGVAPMVIDLFDRATFSLSVVYRQALFSSRDETARRILETKQT